MRFIVALKIAIYLERLSVFLSFFVYLLLWRQIKKALKGATTDQQKQMNLEKGRHFIKY